MGAWTLLIGDPLAELLTPAIRVALPFIQSGVTAGFSANKILDLLQVSGLGVNRSSGLKIIKALQTPYGAPPTITKGTPTDFPDPGIFRVAPFPTSHNYTYVFQITGVNPVTGETEVQYVNVVSNELLTIDDATDLAEDFVDTGQSGNGLEDLETELVQVKLSPFFNM